MFNMFRRSFLAARTHPLLTHLNPGVRHHGRGSGSLDTTGDSTNLTISRRYWSDWSDYEDWDDFRKPIAVKPDNNAEKKLTSRTHCGECGRTNRQRKHLYVVVDDWREGFSVHKLDLDDKGNMVTTSKANSYLCLPPSRVRIAYSGIGAGAWFAAMGVTSRLPEAGHAYTDSSLGSQDCPHRPTSVFSAHFVLTHTPERLPGRSPILKLLQAKHYGAYEGCHIDQIPAPTIAEEKAAKAKAGTYTFHTKTQEWTRLGTWMLPFGGQGCYDPELDAWVGLDVGCHDGDCKIGSCDIPSRAWGSPEPPSWKLCEKDFTLLKSSAPPNTNVNVLVGMAVAGSASSSAYHAMGTTTAGVMATSSGST